MNDIERIKKEQDGLEVRENIQRYAREGFKTIPPDDFVRLRWYGVYQQKPNDGHFMLRVRIPGGDLTAGQLRVVGQIAEQYAHGIADITTRQNFQFHWLTVESLPDVLDRLDAVGIHTAGACGDITRNIVGCPVAGIDPDEILDARPYLRAVDEFFYLNKDFSDLPRKHKMSVAGCPAHCAQPEINDIGATAVRRQRLNGDTELGFHVRVGGGLSTSPYLAQKLNMFVPPDRLVDVCRAVTEIFRDEGYRQNRKRARLKFLMADWGIDRFEAEVRKRLDWTPDPGVEWPEPKHNYRDHVGVHPQSQPGLYWVGAAVLSGRLRGTQLIEAARLAEQYGAGFLRTTNQQNLLFTDIPEHHLGALLEGLDAIDLPHKASAVRRAAVACTGNEFCNLAITETKALIVDIVQHLEDTVALDVPLRINLNGCPNSCGQHHIGDIGLQGCLVRQGDEKVEGYDIFVGGRLGAGAQFVRPIWRKVPATQVKYALERLLQRYLVARDDDEGFGDFVDRHTKEDLAAMMQVQFAEDAGTPHVPVPHGDVPEI
ncbi:MAG: nitrite/sulfite reductase [Chloroflexi bacterium]|nr:nitrite/sulfite reductase [Chloroflexota bacterium]